MNFMHHVKNEEQSMKNFNKKIYKKKKFYLEKSTKKIKEKI